MREKKWINLWFLKREREKERNVVTAFVSYIAVKNCTILLEERFYSNLINAIHFKRIFVFISIPFD